MRQMQRNTIQRIFPVAALMALLLTGCSSSTEEEPTDYFPEDHVIRISTRIAEATVTRSSSAEESTPYTGDFGLFISPTNTTNDFSYQNVWFTFDTQEQTWAPADGIERHWQSKSTPYSYSAYAPAQGSCGSDLTLAVPSTDEGSEGASYEHTFSYHLGKENIDLLWTNGSGTAESLIGSTGALSLLFQHQFCQFTLEITLGNALYNGSYKDEVSPLTAVTLSNATGIGRFNVLTGTLTPTGSCDISMPQKSHTAGSSTSDGTFRSETRYLAPGKQSLTVRMTVNGEKYTYTHPTASYEAGRSYTLKLKVGESIANASSPVIEEWGGTGDVKDLTAL